jgi:L-alanine-DL-glutamate epimerase-like enolase superfamily enzyme
MRISKIRTFVIKVPTHDRFGGQSQRPATLQGSNYYFEAEWKEIYSQHSESLLVRVETDDGVYGWGEGQSPIVPEVARTIIECLLAPVVIGADPRQTTVLWDRMYTTLNGRGQTAGFMLDAMSAIDIALWDIKGKVAGEPISSLLGGPLTSRHKSYISGIRAPSDEARAELAAVYFAEGFDGVKLYLGRGVEADIAQARTVRERVGTGQRLMADLFWKYTLPEAERLGRALFELGVEWIESPLSPEDVHGHVKLARSQDIAVAIGEPLRTRYQFLDWFQYGALDIAQPDIARCGITEGKRIADLASAWHLPVAFHLGVCFGVGIVATWHLAAATPNFLIAEVHPPMFEISNRFLTKPLRIEHGEVVLPEGPGLGIDIELSALREWIVE